MCFCLLAFVSASLWIKKKVNFRVANRNLMWDKHKKSVFFFFFQRASLCLLVWTWLTCTCVVFLSPFPAPNHSLFIFLLSIPSFLLIFSSRFVHFICLSNAARELISAQSGGERTPTGFLWYVKAQATTLTLQKAERKADDYKRPARMNVWLYWQPSQRI